MMLSTAVSAALAWVWLGLVIGVSFLATPIKFSVVDLDLPTALQVGNVTFALFSKLECGLALALLAACALAQHRNGLTLCLSAVIAAGVLAQAVWLLPALDTRVSAIVAGEMPPSSPHHHLYAGIELAKACLLAAIGARSAICDAQKQPATPMMDGGP